MITQSAATPEAPAGTSCGRWGAPAALGRRVAVAAALSCLGLFGACGWRSTASAATSETTPHQARPRLSSAGGTATGAARRAVAARYLAIARAGNRGLDHSLQQLEGRDRNRLRPARADLRYAATVERTFDRRLLEIHFPPRTEKVARTLYRVNQARARLTAMAAVRSTSLARLHVYEERLEQANKRVEAAVRTIRRRLGLPPPPSS